MTYKVFYTDVPLPPSMSQPDFWKLIPFSFDTVDAALAKACTLIKGGAVVWKIEGPRGVEMDRVQIEKTCKPDPLGGLRLPRKPPSR